MLHYFQGRYEGRVIFFSLTTTQLYQEDIEGPPRREDVIIPIHWEVNGGEFRVGELHQEILLSLDDLSEEFLEDDAPITVKG